MKKRSYWAKIIWVTVLLGALVTACTSPPAAPPAPTPGPSGQTPPTVTTTATKPAQKLERVKLQLPSKAATLMNFYLGKEKGLFEQEGINLELIVIKAPLAMAALLAGEVDYSAQGTGPLEAGLGGMPIKQIMGTRSKVLWRLMARPEISSPADLKGKTVSVSSIGATAHFATREAVRYLGLDPDKDVTFVGIPDAEALVALKAGAIAAGGLISPFDLIAKDQGFKELVFTADILDLPFNGLGTTDRKLKENADQVKRMIRATLKSLAYMKDHQNEGKEFLTKEFGVDPKLAPAVYKDLVDTLSLNGGISDKGLKAAVDMSKAQGRIKGEVLVEKGVDLAPLKEVQKEMKLAP